MTNEDKIHEIYCILQDVGVEILENNQANIQILKNQRHLLQQHLPVRENKPQNPPAYYQKPEGLIEETNDILRMMTSGKSRQIS